MTEGAATLANGEAEITLNDPSEAIAYTEMLLEPLLVTHRNPPVLLMYSEFGLAKVEPPKGEPATGVSAPLADVNSETESSLVFAV